MEGEIDRRGKNIYTTRLFIYFKISIQSFYKSLNFRKVKSMRTKSVKGYQISYLSMWLISFFSLILFSVGFYWMFLKYQPIVVPSHRPFFVFRFSRALRMAVRKTGFKCEHRGNLDWDLPAWWIRGWRAVRASDRLNAPPCNSCYLILISQSLTKLVGEKMRLIYNS